MTFLWETGTLVFVQQLSSYDTDCSRVALIMGLLSGKASKWAAPARSQVLGALHQINLPSWN